MDEIQAIDEPMLRHNKIQTKIPGNLNSTCVPLFVCSETVSKYISVGEKELFRSF